MKKNRTKWVTHSDEVSREWNEIEVYMHTRGIAFSSLVSSTCPRWSYFSRIKVRQEREFLRTTTRDAGFLASWRQKRETFYVERESNSWETQSNTFLTAKGTFFDSQSWYSVYRADVSTYQLSAVKAVSFHFWNFKTTLTWLFKSNFSLWKFTKQNFKHNWK